MSAPLFSLAVAETLTSCVHGCSPPLGCSPLHHPTHCCSSSSAQQKKPSVMHTVYAHGTCTDTHQSVSIDSVARCTHITATTHLRSIKSHPSIVCLAQWARHPHQTHITSHHITHHITSHPSHSTHLISSHHTSRHCGHCMQAAAKEAELVRELDKELASIIAFFMRKEADTLSRLEVKGTGGGMCQQGWQSSPANFLMMW